MPLPENVLIDLLASARITLKSSQAAGINQDMFHRVSPQFDFDEADVRCAVDYFRLHQISANGVRLSAQGVVHNLLVFARSDVAIRPFLAQLRQGMTKGFKQFVQNLVESEILLAYIRLHRSSGCESC
jgi:hypothetical protein